MFLRLVFAYIAILGIIIPKYKCDHEPQFILANVSYGADPRQVIDIYLPAERNQSVNSKVIVLIHGGAWAYGSKEQIKNYILMLNASFPYHVIVNMNYRLATIESPAFPKQVDDIRLVIDYLINKTEEYEIKPEFGLFGFSTGAHLALLYGYGFNHLDAVKVICNIVGPTSIASTPYSTNPANSNAFLKVVGNYTYSDDPELYKKASPLSYVTSKSPKTIMFYGGKDVHVPAVQGELLEEALDKVGVYNKFYAFQSAGHGNFTINQYGFLARKVKHFFTNYL